MNKKNTYKLFVAIILLIVMVFCGVYIKKYQDFHRELLVFNKIQLNDRQDKLYYLLGEPTSVNGSMEEFHFDDTSKHYYGRRGYLTGKVGDINSMPLNTKIEDYFEWCYEGNFPCRVDIEFDSTKRVKSIGYYSDNKTRSAWGPVAGIYNGDEEEKVLRLGSPTTDSIDHSTRTIEYSDIGVKFFLTKGTVYMVTLSGPQKGTLAIFKRFLNSQI